MRARVSVLRFGRSGVCSPAVRVAVPYSRHRATSAAAPSRGGSSAPDIIRGTCASRCRGRICAVHVQQLTTTRRRTASDPGFTDFRGDVIPRLRRWLDGSSRRGHRRQRPAKRRQSAPKAQALMFVTKIAKAVARPASPITCCCSASPATTSAIKNGVQRGSGSVGAARVARHPRDKHPERSRRETMPTKHICPLQLDFIARVIGCGQRWRDSYSPHLLESA